MSDYLANVVGRLSFAGVRRDPIWHVDPVRGLTRRSSR